MPCPKCGRASQILGGEYESTQSPRSAKVTLHPDFQRYGKRRVQEALDEYLLRHNEQAARELEESIVEAVPTAGPILDALRGSTSMALAAWVSVLLAIATLILTVTDDQGLSKQELQEVIDAVRDGATSSESTKPAGPSSPSAPSQPGSPPPTVIELPTPDTH